jgi:uncharacterized damage-inducible protein DinB
MTGTADRFRRWFGYEQDAHAKVLASLATVPADRRDGAEYKRAVAIFAHLVGARHVWLYRLGAVPDPPAVLFPENPDLAAVAADWEGLRRKWADYLAAATDADLARVFDYRSFDGHPFRNTIEDVLAHLFTHSAYHRGQIATLVKAAGGTPAATDFVYWCREPAAG